MVVGSNGRLDVVIRSTYRSSSVVVSYFGVFGWRYISKSLRAWASDFAVRSLVVTQYVFPLGVVAVAVFLCLSSDRTRGVYVFVLAPRTRLKVIPCNTFVQA